MHTSSLPCGAVVGKLSSSCFKVGMPVLTGLENDLERKAQSGHRA